MDDRSAIEQAAQKLFEWNTEDREFPRFVLHDVDTGADDPYVALVSKVSGLVNDGIAQARLAAFAEQATSYFTAAYGKDYVYRPPESFSPIEQWMYAIASGNAEDGAKVMASIRCSLTGDT